VSRCVDHARDRNGQRSPELSAVVAICGRIMVYTHVLAANSTICAIMHGVCRAAAKEQKVRDDAAATTEGISVEWNVLCSAFSAVGTGNAPPEQDPEPEPVTGLALAAEEGVCVDIWQAPLGSLPAALHRVRPVVLWLHGKFLASCRLHSGGTHW
jgi:hypothetical protein